MGLNIKNDDVEADIRKLAKAKKVSLTEAIALAVRRELASLARPADGVTADGILAGMKRLRRKHKVSVRPGDAPSDHRWLYDEAGLPK